MAGADVAAALAGSWRPQPAPLTDGMAAGVADALVRTGAGGLGWWRVQATPHASTPEADRLHQVYRLNVLHQALQVSRIDLLVGRLRSAGVEPLLGKGWAVAREYPDPGLRPCGDVDLYVRRADHDAAARAVVGDGADVADLHDGFAELDDRADLEAWSRGVASATGEVRVFGPEDHLRLVALHAVRHGVMRPLWLCDVALLAEAAGPGFDWDRFVFGDPRRTGWAVAALGLARDLLGARLSGSPPRVAEQRVPGWMASAVRHEWGSGRAVHGGRLPFEHVGSRPAAVWRALRERWPNPIEATVRMRAPLSGVPRLPVQLADGLVRVARYAAGAARGSAG